MANTTKKVKRNLGFSYKDKEDLETKLIKTFRGKDPDKYYKVVHPLAKSIVSLILIGHDLDKVEKSIDKALTLNKKLNDLDETILNALWTQAIIFYTKCFTSSDDGFTKLEVKNYVTSKRDRVIHDKFMNVRNSFLAHRGLNNHQHSVLLLITRKTDKGYKREYAAPMAYQTGHLLQPSKNILLYIVRLKNKVNKKAEEKISKLDNIFSEVK